jgi:hypothetical protein
MMNSKMVAALAAAGFERIEQVSTGELWAWSLANGGRKTWNQITEVATKVGRGKWDLSAIVTPIAAAPKKVAQQEPVVMPTKAQEPVVVTTARKISSFAPAIPEKDSNFVPFGIYSDVKEIISSREFVPTMIVGESGNGKTKSVMMACASLKRTIINVSMDYTTTEDELFGKYALVDGNTIWEEGPVLVAMKTGSVLLLDELDRANPETLIGLNMVLDGYTYLCKKTGEYVKAAPGFTVFATCNTKCQGDASDRYVAAKVMDEAFLERFPIVLEQSYPTVNAEVKILSKICADAAFVESLVKWANVTRNTYKSGAITNFVTTRRLTFIAGTNFRIAKQNAVKAVEFGISRFDVELKESLLELFKAIHSGTYEGDVPSVGSSVEQDAE